MLPVWIGGFDEGTLLVLQLQISDQECDFSTPKLTLFFRSSILLGSIEPLSLAQQKPCMPKKFAWICVTGLLEVTFPREIENLKVLNVRLFKRKLPEQYWCNSSSHYFCWFMFQLLYFRPTSLLMAWWEHPMTAQILGPLPSTCKIR